MARLDKIKKFKESVPPPAITEKDAGGVSGFSKNPHQGPDKITYANSGIAPTVTSSKEYIDGALGKMNEDQFESNKEQMNVSDQEYWAKQFAQNPESAYVLANKMFASNETPLEKKKRERREELGQIFSNLGNVIGNAANLYYTSKGSPHIDLNTHQEKENERMQKIRERRQALKDKTDMILFNARLGDMAAARQGKLAADKLAADKYKYNANLAYKKAKDAEKAKADGDKLKETKRHNAAMEAISKGKSTSSDKVYDSAIGSDGYIYTRNAKMSELEAKQIVEQSSIDDLTPFIVEVKDAFGNVTNRRVDWASAAAYALSKGDISGDELVARGFKRGNGGYNSNKENNDSSKTAPYKLTEQKKAKTAPYLR